MKVKTACWIAAVMFLILNAADFITTWVGITSGKGVEANPVWSAFGGPLSPAAITLKLIIIPGTVLGVAWWLSRRFKDLSIGLVMIILGAAVLTQVVANNVTIITKKVHKIAERKQPSDH